MESEESPHPTGLKPDPQPPPCCASQVWCLISLGLFLSHLYKGGLLQGDELTLLSPPVSVPTSLLPSFSSSSIRGSYCILCVIWVFFFPSVYKNRNRQAHNSVAGQDLWAPLRPSGPKLAWFQPCLQQEQRLHRAKVCSSPWGPLQCHRLPAGLS